MKCIRFLRIYPKLWNGADPTDRRTGPALEVLMKTGMTMLLPALLLTSGWLTAQQVKKVPATEVLPGDGKAMFVTYCAACHGQDGKGNGPAATALKKRPADLTLLAARNGASFPTAVLFRYIKGSDEVVAHGSREMPVWGRIFDSFQGPNETALPDMRVNVLIGYLKTIQGK
jgi:mono/diheme cytochrome c family protein